MMLREVLSQTLELWKEPLLMERCRDAPEVGSRLDSHNICAVDDFFFSSLVNRERKFGDGGPETSGL